VRFVFLVAFLLFSVRVSAKEVWTEVRSDHFTVVGNTRVSQLREIAGDLERIRSVFAAAFDAGDPPVPVLVVVTRNERGLRVLAPWLWENGAGPVGFFQDVGVRVQIGVRLDAEDPAGVAFHEYHHLLANVTTPNLPLWLGEGLASLWGEAVFEGRVVDVGRLEPAPHRATFTVPAILRTPAVPGGHVGQYYRSAKIFTHMLRYGRADGAARFDALLREIGNGTPPERAVVTHYGPLEELQQELSRYTRRESYAFQRIEFAKDPATSTSWAQRTLTDAEGLAYVGEFLRLGSRNPSEAEPLLRAALKRDPTAPRALSNLAELSPLPQAEALVRRFEARGDAGFEAHWTAAKVLTKTSAGTAAVARHLETAIDRAPGFVPAWVQLAKIRAGSDPELALELLDRAIEMDPSRPELLVRMARILRDLGHPAEASAIASEGARRAAAVPRPGIARLVCWEMAGLRFGAAALPACDAAIAREPDDWRSRDSRAFARIESGDLAGAAEDFRASARGAKQSGAYSAELLEYRDALVRTLEAGTAPTLREEIPFSFPDEWRSPP